jgi:hypothetical protein
MKPENATPSQHSPVMHNVAPSDKDNSHEAVGGEAHYLSVPSTRREMQNTSALGQIRTADLRFRKPSLYPY